MSEFQAKAPSIEELEQAIVMLRNLLTYDLRDASDFTKNQITQTIRKIESVNKTHVRMYSPSLDLRGDLPETETYIGRFRIRVLLKKENIVRDTVIIRHICEIGLKEAKEFAEVNRWADFEGKWPEIRRAAFIAGGMGFRYSIKDITYDYAD